MNARRDEMTLLQLPPPEPRNPNLRTTSERRGNDLKGFKGFDLTVKVYPLIPARCTLEPKTVNPTSESPAPGTLKPDHHPPAAALLNPKH